jgi:hypothetical protein
VSQIFIGDEIDITEIQPASVPEPRVAVVVEDTARIELPPSRPTYHIPKRRVPETLSAPKHGVKKIRTKQDRTLADKVARAERRPKPKPARKDRYCKTCKISCNSAKTFYDHIHSKGHRSRREIAKVKPECVVCDIEFQSHCHLSRHLKSKKHFKVASKSSN